MYWRIKEKCEYNHMVWRNGKGKSTQIQIEPTNFTLNDPFQYRISQAVIGISGEFSKFENYNRTLIILKGNRLSLFHRQKPNEPIDLDYFKPYNFNGGWDTDSSFIPNTPTNSSSNNNNGNKQLLSVINNNNFDSLSISPNSPINSIQPSLFIKNETAAEETYDFSVISKEGEIIHTCTVISFDEQEHEDEDIIVKTITLNPMELPMNSTLIFFCYNSEVTFTCNGHEKSKLKASLQSDQTLIIKDICLDQFNPQPTIITLTHTKRPNQNECSKVIYIKLEKVSSSSSTSSASTDN